MSSKLLVVASLLLVACSGSSAGVEAFDEPPPAATVQQTPPSSDEDDPQAVKPEADGGKAEQDAGASDANVAPQSDASNDASTNDSGDASDAGAPDAEPDVPRHSIVFTGVSAQRAVADLPTGYANTQEATFEGWFKVDSINSTGRLFEVNDVHCAVDTGGPTMGHITCFARQYCDPCGGTGLVRSKAVHPAGWFHLAFVFNKGSVAMYIDGALQGTAQSDLTKLEMAPPPAAAPGHTSDRLFFGSDGRGVIPEVSGLFRVDEFRLSLDVKYTTSFTPPKHLTASTGSLFLIDDGAGTTSDNGTLRLYSSVVWASVSR